MFTLNSDWDPRCGRLSRLRRAGRVRPVRAAFAISIASILVLGPALLIAAADSPEDVRRRKGELQVVAREAVAAPEQVLPLAAELARAGSPLYATLFARGWATGPTIRAATAEGADKVARALAQKLLLEGDGLPVSGSRWIYSEHARMKSGGDRAPATPRDLLDQRISVLARVAGLGSTPKGIKAVYAPASEKGTLRGDALGWALVTAARLGGEGGFEGYVLLQGAAAELDFLRRQYAFDGTAFVESTLIEYDPFTRPRYFPHAARIVKTGEDDGAPVLEVADKASRLGDQAALLLGASLLARISGAPEEAFPATTASLARDLARFIFRNLAALHFDPSPGRVTFISEAAIGKRGDRVDLADAALAIVAIEAFHEAIPDDAKLRAEAKKLLTAQAVTLLGALAPDGSMPQALELDGGAKPAAPARLGTEALAVQAFLAAARATGEDRWLAAAQRLARSMDARRFDPWAELYLDTDPAAEAVIGPTDTAFLVGALRDIALDAKAPEGIERLRDVWQSLSRAGAFDPPSEAKSLRVRAVR